MNRKMPTAFQSLVLVMAAVPMFTGVARAATIPFSDGFDNYGTNTDTVLNWDQPSTTIWDVTSGTVDLVQSGDFGITCHSGSGCIDLDGSTQNAGILSTITSSPFSLVAGQAYSLATWLSGSQVFNGPDGNEPNEVQFGIKRTLDNVTLASLLVGPLNWNDPWALHALTYTPTQNESVRIFFTSLSGSDDNVGAVMDDASLTAVPLPAAAWLLLSGLIGFGAIARRSKSKTD